MANGEHLQQGDGPVGLAAPERLPWARLVTGLFAVVVSLTMNWRAGRAPVELAGTESPQPQQEQLAARPAVLDPPESEPIQAAAVLETLSPPTAPAQIAARPPRRPGASSRRHEPRRTTIPSKVPTAPVAQRKADVNPWSADYDQLAHTRLTRSRSDVRNEYIAARDQVAALTGEDSGAAYLARQAARQSAIRTKQTLQAHNRSQANRAASAS